MSNGEEEQPEIAEPLSEEEPEAGVVEPEQPTIVEEPIKMEEVVEAKPEPVSEPPSDGIDDLFEVPQPEDNDMAIDHLIEVDEEEDISDLVDVSNEDIIGEAPEPPKKKYRIVPRGSRVIRRQPPPASMQGTRF